ncbi:monovalent cation/H(+) antiporter subunit G [Mycobacterium kyorinense]|uniref:monovalent cation/H(+) antiporter subunit G n=1 Tax=Mycobacterium kyorinense TaxID=487514 RepID=UPI001269CC28|nr:monovalent cation/H(+) antiporter subunit G [Mycobacterium kyorinense]
MVFAGVAVMVLSALGAVTLPRVFDRLHLLAATTSLGVPLIGVGLMISQGWTESSAMIAVTVVVVAVGAPVMTAATGRLAAQHDGLVDEDSPS